MASKPYEIPARNVQVGMQIAVERRLGFAWRLSDVQADPNRHDWRVVLGTHRGAPIVHRGGPGLNGPNVVVRDLPRRDREAIASLVQHIRNAHIAHDRQTGDELEAQLQRRIDSIR
jgi:hypothetical protein